MLVIFIINCITFTKINTIKKINSSDIKNRTKFDYEKLKLADIYDYPSDKEQEEEQEGTKTDIDKFSEQTAENETGINEELFKKYFGFQKPSDIFSSLIDTNHKEKNSKLVDSVIDVLNDLKEDIKKMSEKEIKIEKPNKIVEIAREILEFNIKKQSGKGIKILTPNQMLSRLPISLAQLQAGNNSNKLKNEIRQLFYSLYRSKNMTKQVYNNLIKHI